MAWTDSQSSGSVIDFSEWNTMTTAMQSHSNTWHSDNYYYQESDLTAVLDDNYAPLAGYNSHIANYSNPHQVVWDDVSTAAKVDLANDYAPSSGYHTHITDTSNPHSVSWTDISTVAIADLNSNYPGSSNVYNRNWIDSLSGSIDGRLDALSPFDGTDYITSSNAISRFADSSSIQTKFLHSGVVLNAVSSLTISGGSIIGNTITTTGRISSATGIYSHFISANNTNLSTAGETPSSWTWTIPVATSGVSVSNIGKVSGSLAIYIDDYIASTNAISRFADSSNIQSKFIHSGVTLNSISSNKVWVGTGYISAQTGLYADWISGNSSNLIGGVSTFTALTDTPSAYSGSGNKLAVVNGSEDSIVFREIVCTNTDVVIAGASVVLV